MRFKIFMIVALVFTLAGGVDAQLVEPRGSGTTIDIATWNLKEFPLAGPITTTVVGLMVGDLDLDLIGVEEITDPAALSTAASTAGGWGSLTGPSYAGDIRMGILYDNSAVEVTGEPFSIPGNGFTRNPFVVPVSVTENDSTLNFHFVVLHLKAYHTPEDIETRMQEIAALKSYLDGQLQLGEELNWVVVGDFNDELDDPEASNIFLPFLEDEEYAFLTLPMVGDPDQASYPNYGSLIDHLMITANLFDSFGDNGAVETLRLDQEYSQYFEQVSDHRPVAAYFPTGATWVGERPMMQLPALPELSLWPVPGNGTVTVVYTLAHGSGMLSVYDLLGRRVEQIPLTAVSGRVTWNAAERPSGVYLMQVRDSGGRVANGRAVVMK